MLAGSYGGLDEKTMRFPRVSLMPARLDPFSQISGNWQGEPLRDYETILNFIRTTTTTSGLRCRAELDTRPYTHGITITAEQRKAIRIRRSTVLPQWNYTIYPRP